MVGALEQLMGGIVSVYEAPMKLISLLRFKSFDTARPVRKIVFVLILILIALSEWESAYGGRWKRGVPVTSILPMGPHQRVQLLSEYVICLLNKYYATVKAIYILKNTSDKRVKLRAGIWRYGSDYLEGIQIKTNKLLFNVNLDLRFQRDLDSMIIPEGLDQAFHNIRIYLSQNSTVLIQEEGKSWQIVDGNKTYTVEKEQNQLKVYEYSQNVSIEMVEVENQSAYRGPDYLLSLHFRPNEQITVEVNCQALMYLNQDNERWLFYQGSYGARWFATTDRLRIQFVAPEEEKWTLVEASPMGYRQEDCSLVWDNVTEVRKTDCFARYR